MAGKRGSYAKSELRKQAIGEAALELVMERGHRAVTMAEIADRVGVSEPLLFYHFPSKEALLVAALRQFDAENIRPLGVGGAIADMPSRAAAGVRREHLVHLQAEMSGAAFDAGHPAREYFRDRWERSFQVVAEDIEMLQRDGVVPGAVDARRAARALLAAWEGLQVQWMHGPEFDIRTEFATVIRALLGLDEGFPFT
ncbi:TetR/AcrR family transcriptional regulator [Streptomyces hebeiensis]|uniref:TetR/AcrR family transcriptional regulator n=1 Tax=Streptomyces hebeiensis TaxID=229486 RepID=A0ABN1UPU3_9ACTN